MMTWPVVFMIAGQSLDLGTTAYKLQHGCRELNPVMRAAGRDTTLGISLVKGGAMVSLTWSLGRLSKDHPKIATGGAIIAGAAGVAAALYNSQVRCQP